MIEQRREEFDDGQREPRGSVSANRPACTEMGRSPDSVTVSCWSVTSPAGMRRPLRRWSICMVPWYWACAAECLRDPQGHRRRVPGDFLDPGPQGTDDPGPRSFVELALRCGLSGRAASADANAPPAGPRDRRGESRGLGTPPEPADILEMGPVLDQELNRLPRKYRVPLDLVLPQRAHARPGGGGAGVSRRDSPQPSGAGTRLAQAAADEPGPCSDRGDPGRGRGLSGETP